MTPVISTEMGRGTDRAWWVESALPTRAPWEVPPRPGATAALHPPWAALDCCGSGVPGRDRAWVSKEAGSDGLKAHVGPVARLCLAEGLALPPTASVPIHVPTGGRPEGVLAAHPLNASEFGGGGYFKC